MDEQGSLQKRMMLQGYEQQLLAARRLARFRVRRRVAMGLIPDDPDPSIKRNDFVEKVARELYESLIFTGSDNPIVEDIRREISDRLGFAVRFTYPPGKRLQIMGETEDGLRPLTEEEDRIAHGALLKVTRGKVDGSMLTGERP